MSFFSAFSPAAAVAAVAALTNKLLQLLLAAALAQVRVEKSVRSSRSSPCVRILAQKPHTKAAQSKLLARKQEAEKAHQSSASFGQCVFLFAGCHCVAAELANISLERSNPLLLIDSFS